MTLRGWLLLLVVLVGLGCARRDWIADTLVTVDVSGTWHGAISAGSPSTTSTPVDLTLAQRGPKVTGMLLVRGEKTTIEGTVRGDVFSFATLDGRVRAELTVTGDEMTGHGVSMATMSRQVNVTLKRQP
jgi:hypothetical protein